MGATRVIVDIEDGGMRATVSIEGGSSNPSIDDALSEANVVAGIDRSRVDELEQRLGHESFSLQGAVIASGTPAIPGEDERIEIDLRTQPVAGKSRRDGSLDYRERRSLTNVEVGDLIGRWIAPTAGTPGVTIHGEPIEATDGQERNLCGEGVEVDPSTGVIRATRPGVLVFVESTGVAVTDLTELDHDVNYESGNLHANASVHVHGSVHPKFVVEATGTVHVDGLVDDGSIRSQAHVTVDGGVIGREHGVIRARGDVSVRFTNHANVRAGGSITIEDHSIDSVLSAHHVFALDRRGALIGGCTTARESIRVRAVGCEHETTTEVVVAVATEERHALRRRKLEIERDARRTRKRGNSRGKRAKSGHSVDKRRHDLQREQRRVSALEDTLLEQAFVEVHQTAFVGTKIRFGHHVLELTRPNARVRFVFDRSTRSIHAEKLTT